MNFENIVPHKSISLFVKSILVFEQADKTQKTILPFFADGYPGLMYQDSENGLLVSPHNKTMPTLFLYGQTIKPIQLILDGCYTLIIFQFYPFVLKSFFGVYPVDLNDDCYNLETSDNEELKRIICELKNNSKIQDRISAITSFLYSIFQIKQESLDFIIRQAIQIIMDCKGQISVSKLPAELKIGQRTLERRFLKEVGVSLKQFSKMIQFQSSLEQLTLQDFKKLTDIVYTNGFADQSHFIKVFKAYTGKTPTAFYNRKE